MGVPIIRAARASTLVFRLPVHHSHSWSVGRSVFPLHRLDDKTPHLTMPDRMLEPFGPRLHRAPSHHAIPWGECRYSTTTTAPDSNSGSIQTSSSLTRNLTTAQRRQYFSSSGTASAAANRLSSRQSSGSIARCLRPGRIGRIGILSHIELCFAPPCRCTPQPNPVRTRAN